jgi:hypothetical protein
MNRRRPLLALLYLLTATGLAKAAEAPIICHVTYGGETQHLRLDPVSSPYTVAPQQIGSYFLWRAYMQTPPSALPAVHISVAANLDEGALPIHVAAYPYPQQRGRKAPGFTGYQTVYEPVRDGELQYWCAREGKR